MNVVRGVLLCIAFALSSVVPTASAGPWVYKALADRLLLFASATQCPLDELSRWNCKRCVDPHFEMGQIITASSVGGQAYVGYSNTLNAIIVAFRGSTVLKNWIYDGMFVREGLRWGLERLCPECGAHEGFLKSYDAMRAQTLTALRTANSRHPGVPVYFTGHSLGAAEATLAFLDVTVNLAREFPPSRMHMIHFGSPRVGNAKFAAFFTSMTRNSVIARVVHARDAVPHLPPEATGYRHFPQEVWEKHGEYKVCDRTNGEDDNCSDSQTLLIPTDHIKYMGMDVRCKTLPGQVAPPSAIRKAATRLKSAVHHHDDPEPEWNPLEFVEHLHFGGHHG
eukprot:GFYU01006300.1.p1 GENE.GFYU01006300.1~~GFYU01006300.1.p1  ORF type:complete len:337 (+),score=56.03 GFYU01006300.1:84-1094(+)